MNTCMDVQLGKEAGIDDKYLDASGAVRRPEAGLSSGKAVEVSASEKEDSQVRHSKIWSIPGHLYP